VVWPNGLFGKAYLGALLRLALSDIRKYCPQPASLALHPISIFPLQAVRPLQPELNILVANSGIHRSSCAILCFAVGLEPTRKVRFSRKNLINVVLTVYVVIGTKLEEKKLVLEYGDKYIKYQQEVPMLIPFTKARSASI